MQFISLHREPEGYIQGVNDTVTMMIRLMRNAGVDFNSRTNELIDLLTQIISLQTSLAKPSESASGDEHHARIAAHKEIAKAVFAGLFTPAEFYRRFPEYRGTPS